MKTRNLLLAAGSCAALAALAVGVSRLSAGTADGEALYLKNCASCHGKDGTGNKAMAKALKAAPGALDLVDAGTQGKSDEELIQVASEGVGKMPGYKGKLADDAIASVIAYLRSLAPKPK